MKKETLQRAVKFFEEIDSVAKQNGVVTSKEIRILRSKHKTNVNYITACICLGYYKRKSYGVYASNVVGNIQPIQVRNIINKTREMYPPTKYEPKDKKQVVAQNTKLLPVVKQSRKTASIFWGLIKFQY